MPVPGMDAAVYVRPFASVPTRKPRTPAETPMPDLEKFSLSGPSLRLRRNRQAIACQVYAIAALPYSHSRCVLAKGE